MCLSGHTLMIDKHYQHTINILRINQTRKMLKTTFKNTLSSINSLPLSASTLSMQICNRRHSWDGSLTSINTYNNTHFLSYFISWCTGLRCTLVALLRHMGAVSVLWVISYGQQKVGNSIICDTTYNNLFVPFGTVAFVLLTYERN